MYVCVHCTAFFSIKYTRVVLTVYKKTCACVVGSRPVHTITLTWLWASRQYYVLARAHLLADTVRPLRWTTGPANDGTTLNYSKRRRRRQHHVRARAFYCVRRAAAEHDCERQTWTTRRPTYRLGTAQAQRYITIHRTRACVQGVSARSDDDPATRFCTTRMFDSPLPNPVWYLKIYLLIRGRYNYVFVKKKMFFFIFIFGRYNINNNNNKPCVRRNKIDDKGPIVYNTYLYTIDDIMKLDLVYNLIYIINNIILLCVDNDIMYSFK